MTRIAALLGKELSDLRQTPTVFVPAIITGLMAIVLPFFVAVIVPAISGERLADSSDFQVALELYRDQPEMRDLDPEAAIQAWIFQQFLILLVLTPVAASMSVAAYSVIGEKQARTLEPLLATPLTTFELLAAKVLGSLIPALALTLAGFALYVGAAALFAERGAFRGLLAPRSLAIVFVLGPLAALYVGAAALFAEPGAFRGLLTPRSLAIVFALGPLAALAALQMAVCVSSRVNDARSAQQVGALIILPIAALLVAQVSGAVVLGGTMILLISVGLVALNAALMLVGIAIFDRESILTRWK